jgi:hypothetical protein
VFKVEPPVGGYQKGIALVYDLPEGYDDSTYNFTISMKVLIEGGDSSAGLVWQYLGNDDNILSLNTTTKGEWVPLSAGSPFVNTASTKVFPGTDFLYLLGGDGLKNATVYIKDITVTWDVQEPDPDEYWHGFFMPGRPANYSGATGIAHESLAIGGGTYNDVLEIVPPSGGYVCAYDDYVGSTLYRALESGTYELSMSVLLESPTPADFILTDINGSNFFYEENIQLGVWHTFEPQIVTIAPFPFDGALGIHLWGCASNKFEYNDYRGLKDATIFIRDLKLVKIEGSNRIIIAESASNLNTDPVITLSWADTGFNLIASPANMTIQKGTQVTITAPSAFTEYEWYIGTKEITDQTRNEFIFDSSGLKAGLYKISLIAYQGDVPAGCDTIEITVTN